MRFCVRVKPWNNLVSSMQTGSLVCFTRTFMSRNLLRPVPTHTHIFACSWLHLATPVIEAQSQDTKVARLN